MAFSFKSQNRLQITATLFFCVVAASMANAGSLATTNFALNDGFGPDAGRWHGSVTVTAALFGNTVTAEVDWAAFYRAGAGIGRFQQYLNSQAIAQADPSAPLEVLYAYQIVSVTAATPGVGLLTVGLDAGDGRGGVSAPSFVPTGAATEVAPTGGGDNTTSMGWIFGNDIDVGDTSPILVFTSPFAPELDFLQVRSGLASPSPSPLVASPSDRLVRFDIPEPSSVLLGLLGCMGFIGSRRRAAH